MQVACRTQRLQVVSKGLPNKVHDARSEKAFWHGPKNPSSSAHRKEVFRSDSSRELHGGNSVGRKGIQKLESEVKVRRRTQFIAFIFITLSEG